MMPSRNHSRAALAAAALLVGLLVAAPARAATGADGTTAAPAAAVPIPIDPERLKQTKVLGNMDGQTVTPAGDAAATADGATAAPAAAPAPGTTASPMPAPMPASADSVAPEPPPDMSVLPLVGAGKIRITVALDRAVIRVGDLIHYSMTVESPPGSKVMMPPPGAQLGAFLIRDYAFPGLDEKEPTRLERVQKYLGSIIGGDRGASLDQTFNFTITAYATGDLIIPTMPVVVVDPTGREHLLHVESARVRVAPVTNPEDLTIRDIKPPRSLPVNYRPALPWLLLPVGLLLAAAAVWWRVRNRKRAVFAPAVLRPEDEVALEELAALAGEGLLEAGNYDPFYTRLSHIFRRYLALRYSIYALEYTTPEITARLGQAYLDHAEFDRIRTLLEEADRVKFASLTPTLDERSTVLDRARALVERTRRQPAPAPDRMAA